MSSIPGMGRSPRQGNGKPLQYSCLGDPMDREALQATVHESMGWQRVRQNWATKALTQLKWGDQKWVLSCPVIIADTHRKKKDSSSFPARLSLGVFTIALPTSFLLYTSGLLPLPCGDFHVACRGHRPQIAIVCWSRINLSLPEKYLAVYLS